MSTSIYSKLRYQSLATVGRFFSYYLNKEQNEMKKLCQKFAEEELKPHAESYDKNSLFPKPQIEKLSVMGLTRATVPREFGGLGLDMVTLAICIEELSKGCASTGFIIAIHNCLFANLLLHKGTQRQIDEFLINTPKKSLGCFALSEKGAGSDVASIQTTAVKDGDHWILNGKKTWVTNGFEAKGMILFATTDKELKHNGLACFVVPMNKEGIFRSKKNETLGIRAVTTCSISIEDLRLSDDYLIGDVGDGFRIAMNQLDQARVGVSAHALGIAEAALESALKHATELTSVGRSLYRIPAVQDRLADMKIQIETTRLLVYKAATDISTENSAMAKYVAGKCASSVADHCVQIFGGDGILVHENAERHFRDARGTQIYGGATDVQKMIIGRSIIKEYLRARNCNNC